MRSASLPSRCGASSTTIGSDHPAERHRPYIVSTRLRDRADAAQVGDQNRRAFYDAGFPAAVLSTNDIDVEYERLKGLGVKFRGKPKKVGSGRFVFFDDTCGNLIVLRQGQ
jgi:hypothetical protein